MEISKSLGPLQGVPNPGLQFVIGTISRENASQLDALFERTRVRRGILCKFHVRMERVSVKLRSRKEFK